MPDSSGASSVTLVVGDLHLFAARSKGIKYWKELPAILKKDDVESCVLMGDIFDFPWARQIGHDAAVAQAAQMVEKLVREFPKVDFHYLFGNHDQSPAFECLLTTLSEELSKFSAHEVYLRFGEIVFMHGDAADHRKMSVETLLRRRRVRAGGSGHGGIQERIYRIVVALRIDEAPSWLPFFPTLVHRRLRAFIEQEGIHGIEHVVYGHTHRSLDRVDQGVRFTNAGSPIGYRKKRPLCAGCGWVERKGEMLGLPMDPSA